ncbi:MAG: hypothetical protein QOG46_2171 [Pseudonocardiales bacterium]|nr:hypothetical protein [Pseudonocardiales bacterium]
MSSTSDTRGLIEQAVQHLATELPALRQLKLVIRLELKSRGESPIWRVELPDPKVTKDPAADARVDVSVIRANFNELATDGTLKQWVKAYERGQVQISGDQSVVKLVGNVIARHLARARA